MAESRAVREAVAGPSKAARSVGDRPAAPASDKRIMHPDHYYSILNPEDRLFVPEEYVHLFESRGWVRPSP